MGNIRRENQVVPFVQSDALLQSVLDHAATGMVLLSAEGRLLYANPAFAALLGFSGTEISRLSLSDLAPDDALSAAAVQFERLRVGKINALEVECQYRHRDGQLIWVRLSASVLQPDGDGTPTHYFLQLSDIDQQKRDEAARAYNEARWINALEAAGQGVWDHDIRKDKMFYSRHWRQMRGYRDDEEVDDALEVWLARLHPEDRARIRAVVKKQDSGENGHDALVYREKHRNGHYVWIWSRGRPVEWDENGTPTRTVGIDTDITHIKQIEAELADEKERLRVTLEAIDEGVIATDAKGRITFINDAAERMLAKPADDAVGKPIGTIFDTYAEDGKKTRVQSVLTCLSSGEVCRVDDYSRLLQPDGSMRFLKESASPLFQENGEITGAVVVFRDATATREMHSKLEYSALHDSLTGLPNRLAFEREMQETLELVRDEGRSAALCLIDLDHFKQVNDNAGHMAGDRLLKQVADVIRDNCRRNDFSARLGGDEFAVVLKDCGEKPARRVANAIAKAIGRLNFKHEGETYKVGASVGVAPFDEQSPCADTTYKKADAACYDAKNGGRNRVVVAPFRMTTKSS
ncbi:MAG: PAS domain S-box protein [Hyphomicrobiaceae bacterium]|nr:PAS domain S-box protein [Hyphomicrobiaceae bacterium]MCC0025275.1 PAS domain S-box protein [Hyphomicrobiaceae bacterium]